MGHNHNRILALQLEDQVLDLRGRNRVQRRRRFVHQQHLGIDRQRARNAHPLLLPARQTRARLLLQLVLHLFPQRRRLQAALHRLVQNRLVAEPIQLQPARHIVVDRHGRKRVWPLKDHPHAAANVHRRGVLVDVQIAHLHHARRPRNRVGLVHPVQAAHKRALAAARRPNQRRRVVGGNIQIDVL